MKIMHKKRGDLNRPSHNPNQNSNPNKNKPG